MQAPAGLKIATPEVQLLAKVEHLYSSENKMSL